MADVRTHGDWQHKSSGMLMFAGRKNKPQTLKPGDTIAIVAPATPISKTQMTKDIRLLENFGFKVVQYASTDNFKRHYLSDSDEGRADAINRAFANPEVKAVFSAQGGAGTFRKGFLDKLNWDLIRKNPKIVTGYSDITFLHLALRKMAKMVSFHAAFPHEILAKTEHTKRFWKLMMPEKPGELPDPIQAGKTYRCFSPGETTGELIGGNMSLMAASLNTPYEPDFEGKVLLLEEWDSHYEDIDRYMSQLEHAGVFNKIKGLILGQFAKVPRSKGDYSPGLTKEQVFRLVAAPAIGRGIPVGYNFPVGHTRHNLPIPLGVKVKFNSETGTLTYLESPFKTEKKSS